MTDIKELITPKRKVSYLYDDIPVKEALEKLKTKRFSAVPVLNRDGKYIFSLSEGDLLWNVLENRRKTLRSQVGSIQPDRLLLPVKETDSLNDVLELVSRQNYVPVIDEEGKFVGIITRKALIAASLKNRVSGK